MPAWGYHSARPGYSHVRTGYKQLHTEEYVASRLYATFAKLTHIIVVLRHEVLLLRATTLLTAVCRPGHIMANGDGSVAADVKRVLTL